MSKTTIEDKEFVLARMRELMIGLDLKSLRVQSYEHLRMALGLPREEWSLTRLSRTLTSLHHNERSVKIVRPGEPMRSNYVPRDYVFTVKPLED